MFFNRLKFFIQLLVLVAVIGFQNQVSIPVTYLLDDAGRFEQLRVDRELTRFIISITGDGRSALKGIYIANKFQLPVTYQPSGNPGFVSSTPDVVTFFSTASNYGSIGLIAHNNLAGIEFFEIDLNDEISLVYGDGAVRRYVVSDVREYQALSPTSPYSSFVNLADPGHTISYRDLFFDTYGIGDRLVLQTCIANGNYDSWGRLFIIATPID